MKEATARIKINKHLEAAGWRFFPEGEARANICLEPSVAIKTSDLDALGDDFERTRRGFVDFVLLDARGFVLIMIDGKRSVDELSVLLRPGEVDAVIAQLESAGLIQRSTGSHALDVPTVFGREAEAMPTTQWPATREEGNPMTLDEAKRRAVRELTDRLGPGAEGVSLRIESSRTIEDFRERVREAERLVTAALGPAAAADYLRALRKR